MQRINYHKLQGKSKEKKKIKKNFNYIFDNMFTGHINYFNKKRQ